MKPFMKSFYHCFFLLDECYFITHDSDLGGVLGAMSPLLFGGDSMPIDRAYLNYWADACASCDSKNILVQTGSFLTLLSHRFGFTFPETKKLLTQAGIEEIVLTAAQRADEEYRRHVKSIADTLSGLQ